jgi:7-cyano-7-deazaguanine synthase
MKSKSLCLVSGGLDSCVAAAIALEETKVEAFLSIAYGQRHTRELQSAHDLANHYKIRHFFIQLLDLGNVLNLLGASALTDMNEQLPKERRMSEMTARVPRTYVPGRNTIMLALAQSVGEALNVDEIYTGFNAVDFSGYPDCRPIFVEAWNHLAHYATKRGYENNPIILVAPVINLSKASVVRCGIDLDAPLQLTWSCYEGGAKPCGVCDSCIIRFNAFAENNVTDPIGPYEIEPHRSVL